MSVIIPSKICLRTHSTHAALFRIYYRLHHILLIDEDFDWAKNTDQETYFLLSTNVKHNANNDFVENLPEDENDVKTKKEARHQIKTETWNEKNIGLFASFPAECSYVQFKIRKIFHFVKSGQRNGVMLI